jgi:hypothetical protein
LIANVLEEIKPSPSLFPGPKMSPIQALDRALNATPTELPTPPDYDAPEGVTLGNDVTVSPLDEKSPATGRLIYHDDRRIVLRCTHERVGEVNAHFPRTGYRVRRSVR